MATVKKLKKAQNGVKKKPITENTFRFGKNMGTDSPTMSSFDSMRKSAGLDRSNRIDTSARAKAIASGAYREDKKSGDLFRVKKSKNGASVKAKSGASMKKCKYGCK
jgi:hypothetical protein